MLEDGVEVELVWSTGFAGRCPKMGYLTSAISVTHLEPSSIYTPIPARILAISCSDLDGGRKPFPAEELWLDDAACASDPAGFAVPDKGALGKAIDAVGECEGRDGILAGVLLLLPRVC